MTLTHVLAKAYGVLPSEIRDMDAADVAFAVRVLGGADDDAAWRAAVKSGTGKIYRA